MLSDLAFRESSPFCSLSLRTRLRARRNRHRALHYTHRLIVAVVRRIDKKLRFLKQLYCAVEVGGFTCADEFPGLEQVLGEFAAGVLVPKKLGVIERSEERRVGKERWLVVKAGV